MSSLQRDALVIGYGNTLRSDDAFGPHVAEHLRHMVDSSRVEVTTKHCLTPEVASDLAAVSVAVFIDCSVDGEVGELRCRRLKCPKFQATTMGHSLEPPDLLAMAEELFGSAPRAHLISVRGESFQLQSDRLSASVRSVVKPAALMVLSILECELNFDPRRDPVDVSP